ncbi:transporter, major facilitator family [Lysobacter enzymogenes]|uniref:Transporter, major facilitator family n=1 Tax=Lysobacter enzymogenes TaxID=69 RepID=A0A0S2DBP9_LYSEN|nr:MFS transporter [Lysobacter enzymogenes]ALN55905.1 transporter, major facilitator family [Lysobacter enzymogenes]QCW24869.1 MFS transporter [Lysobacter enzymogenes]
MSRWSGLRDFLLIWFGQLVSGVGSRLTTFALGVWVLQTTGSTTRFALVFVSMAVPALLISPFAGALVDRWDRRRTMIVCEAISAATMLALAGLLASGHLAMWHIYAGVGAVALSNAFLQPAYAASIPLLASADQLTRVNGLVQTGFAVAQVGGPLLAGVLVSTISLQGVLVVDALTFVIGLLALCLAKVPRLARDPQAPQQGLWQEASTGFAYVRERRGLMGLLIVFGLSNFMFGIASIAITPLILSVADPALLGVQMAIGGSGLLFGGLLMSTWGGPRRRVVGVLGFSMLAGLFLAAHGLRPSFPLLVVAGFAFFLSVPVINACNATLWQSKVPAELQGRCFAIQRVLAESAMPLAFCLAGPLAEHVFEPLMAADGALAGSLGLLIGVGPGRGLGLMFLVLGAAMMTIAAVAWSRRAIREVENDLPDALAAPAVAHADSEAPAGAAQGDARCAV